MHIQVTPASNVPGTGIIIDHGPGPILPVGGLGCGALDGELDGKRFDAWGLDGWEFDGWGFGGGEPGGGGLGDGELEGTGTGGTGFGGGGGAAAGAGGTMRPAAMPE